jgi:mRNA interferase RelE/StbE
VAEYSVYVLRAARRELEELPEPLSELIVARIRSLAQEPRPHGIVKLRGPSQLWRIRIRDYRIIYNIFDETKTVEITQISHRREAYRNL